jgi:hypothetical protein
VLNVKRGLLRSITAGLLAVALVSGTAQNAQAAPGDVKPMAVDPYSIIIEIGINLLGRAFAGGGVSETDLNAAIAQITAQIEQAKTDIINHVDAVASAEVQACVRTHTIEFQSINSMSPTVRQLWAQNATSCAELATAYLGALTSGQAVDNIGWLVGEIFTIAIAARTKAGLIEGLSLLREDEVTAFTRVRDKLTPSCYYHQDPSGAPIVAFWRYYTCTAYNGVTATGQEFHVGATVRPPLIDPPAVEAEATKNTSRPVAISSLATLQNIHPVM